MYKQKPKLSKSSLGFTFPEIIIVVLLISILATVIVINLSPAEMFARGRDNRRVSDLSTLERAVSEYKATTQSLPDSSSVMRTSNVLPPGNTGPLVNAASGWFAVNMSNYLVKLPIDPQNSGVFVYRYLHNGLEFELDATLEAYLELMTTDGGDDSNRYEVGDNLTLL